jgi:hypothetical protein
VRYTTVMERVTGVRKYVAASLLVVIILVSSLAPAFAATDTLQRDFSLQVTPSPLVTTVKPGQLTIVELKVRNGGTSEEKLKIVPRSFTLQKDSSNVRLNDTTPPDIAQWISFSAPNFTVQPGEWFTEQVRFNLPAQSGFSYSFALLISRQSEQTPTSAGRLLKGSVAVFTLVNVDRPGATRTLDLADFSSQHKLYEFLPARLNVQFKNTGNTIVQPYGNIFIKRGGKQIATLPVNEQRGYILPGNARTITTSWVDGFPAYKTVRHDDGSTSTSLSWNWADLANFRIGKYTAELVAVYNDGTRDVPVRSEISFWIIPWRAFLLLLVIIIVIIWLQRRHLKKRTDKAVRKALEKAKRTEE